MNVEIRPKAEVLPVKVESGPVEKRSSVSEYQGFGFPEGMSIALRSIPKYYDPYIANRLPAVKKAVQRLAFDVSSLPIRVEERMEKAGKLVWEPVYGNDPEVMKVTEKWTAYESSALGIEMMMRSLAIYGITVVNVTRDDNMQLDELQVYDPRVVTRIPMDYGPFVEIDTVIYGESYPRGRLAILYWEPPEDRWRVRPPLSECWAAIRAGLCATAFAGGYFDFAALGRLLLKPPAHSDMENQREKRDQDDKEADKRRLAGRNDIYELRPGWDAIPIPVEARDVVTEMRKFAVEEVSRIIGPPQPLVDNLDRATYSNIDGVKLDYRQALVATWARKIGTELSRAIWPSGERRVRLLVEESLLYSRKERLEANAIAIASGQLTQNEGREREDLEPLADEGADRLIRNPQVPVIAMPMTEDSQDEAPIPTEEGEME